MYVNGSKGHNSINKIKSVKNKLPCTLLSDLAYLTAGFVDFTDFEASQPVLCLGLDNNIELNI